MHDWFPALKPCENWPKILPKGSFAESIRTCFPSLTQHRPIHWCGYLTPVLTQPPRQSSVLEWLYNMHFWRFSLGPPPPSSSQKHTATTAISASLHLGCLSGEREPLCVLSWQYLSVHSTSASSLTFCAAWSYDDWWTSCKAGTCSTFPCCCRWPDGTALSGWEAIVQSKTILCYLSLGYLSIIFARRQSIARTVSCYCPASQIIVLFASLRSIYKH